MQAMPDFYEDDKVLFFTYIVPQDIFPDVQEIPVNLPTSNRVSDSGSGRQAGQLCVKTIYWRILSMPYLMDS